MKKLPSNANLVNISFQNLAQISKKSENTIHCSICERQILIVGDLESARSVEDGALILILNQNINMSIMDGSHSLQQHSIKIVQSGQFKGCAVQDLACRQCHSIVGFKLLSAREEDEFQYVDRLILSGQSVKVLMTNQIKSSSKLKSEKSVRFTSQTHQQPQQMNEKDKIAFILSQINQNLPSKFEKLEEKFQLLMKQFDELKRANVDSSNIEHIFNSYREKI